MEIKRVLKTINTYLLPAGPALFLLLNGCGETHTAVSQPPQVETTSVYVPPPVAPASALKIYGPRPEADIAALYSRPIHAAVPQTASVFNTGWVGNVPCDPSWNVALGRTWRYIVIHHSASIVGSAASFDRWHRERGWDGLGYDFVIGNGAGSGDGQVEVGYRWTKQLTGAHAGVAEYNQYGIGICLVGDFENGYPTAGQMASLTRLVRFLQAKCGIPTSEILGHRDCKMTECPGRHFDVAAFRASLGGGGAVSVVRAPAQQQPLRAERTATTTTTRSGMGLP